MIEDIKKEIIKLKEKNVDLVNLLNDEDEEVNNFINQLIEELKITNLEDLEKVIVKEGGEGNFFNAIKEQLEFYARIYKAAKKINEINVEKFIPFLNRIFENFVVYESKKIDNRTLLGDFNEEDLKLIIFAMKIVTERYITSFIQKDYLADELKEIMNIEIAKLNLIFQQAETYRNILTTKYLFKRLEMIENKLS